LTGAIAGEQKNSNVSCSNYYKARNILSDNRIPILKPSHPLQHAARPVWVAEKAKVTHESLQGKQHSFSYNVSEMLVVDVSQMPQYWWGGEKEENRCKRNIVNKNNKVCLWKITGTRVSYCTAFLILC
jgi:hypothetical protein